MSTATEEETSTEKAAKIVLPGEKVTLSFGEAQVFPMGVRHVRLFNEKIMKAVSTAFQYTAMNKSQDDSKIAETILASMMPMVVTDLIDVVEACTKLPDGVEFDDMPHYDLPKIAEVWLMDSFGTEEKRRPWVEAVERAIHCFTGKKSSISEMLSKYSAQQGTADKTSTSTDNSDSPTPDGPSPSSSSS